MSFQASSANCQEYRPPGGIGCSRLPRLAVGDTIDITIDAMVTDSVPDESPLDMTVLPPR
jgi:hypothetical protein